jgi:hypothetical protein
LSMSKSAARMYPAFAAVLWPLASMRSAVDSR